MLQEEGDKKFKELALERTLKSIRTLQQQGYGMKDIAILVRRGSEGSEIAQYLSAEGIRVISSDSILLGKSPVVNFLISLIKLLFDPLDPIVRAEVLHYFFFYLHSDTDLNVDPAQRIREIVDEDGTIQAVFEALPKEFSNLRFRLDQLPLYELAEELVRIFELQKAGPAFVQHFLDLVLEYSERKKPDLGGFLSFWEEKKYGASVVIPAGEDAVEIMTLHKSKGLEFPVVLLPFVNWSLRPKTNSMLWASAGDSFGEFPDTFLVNVRVDLEHSRFVTDYQSEVGQNLLDNLNLLYVAFTRPRERLYIFAPFWKPPRDGRSVAKMSDVGKLINLVMDDARFQGLDSMMYESGLPIPPEGASEESNSVKAEEFISEPWRKRIRIDRKFRKYWSDEGRKENEAGEEGFGIAMGTLLKDLFGRMKDVEEMGMALNAMEEAGLVDAAAAEEVRRQAEKSAFPAENCGFVCARPGPATRRAAHRIARRSHRDRPGDP